MVNAHPGHGSVHGATQWASATASPGKHATLSERLHAHIEAGLASIPPPPTISGAAKGADGRLVLRSVNVEPGCQRTRVVINVSRELLLWGLGSADFENVLHTLHQRAHDALDGRIHSPEYEIRIEGEPLAAHFGFEQRWTAPTLGQATGRAVAKSLAARRITVSPGHGYYWSAGRWQLQRSYFFGIVEDFINSDFIIRLDGDLRAAGALVRPTRELDKAAGVGESGFAKWQEASRYFVKGKGVPEVVWNSLASDDDLSDDIRVRPLYANWKDADGHATEVIISLHNNGGGGTGTETWYDTQNGFQVESRRLADAVHTRLVAAIRSQFSASWVDRGVKGSAGGYGENRLATRPAILIEVAFMDTRADNAAMQEARFRELVSAAIRDGVAAYVAGRIDTSPPTAPEAVATRAVSARQIDLTWTPSSDDVGVAAYRILRDGIEIGATTTPSFGDVGLTAATTYRYEISARDAAGNWSTATTVSATTTPQSPYTGLWWVPAQSGWGMTLTQHAGTVFAAIYTFAPNGDPEWLVVPQCPVSGERCEGDVFRVSGGTAPTVAWDARALKATAVGRVSLVFAGNDTLAMSLNLGSQTVTHSMQRNSFASPVTSGVDYSDLWWNAAESGWGTALVHQGDTVFVAWYAYAESGRDVWYVAPSCRVARDRCASELFRVRGGQPLTQMWTGAVLVDKVGDIELAWSHPSIAVMTFTIGGKSGSRRIVRNPF
jgi:N-acetylmuramoyl-L-alanine amidase